MNHQELFHTTNIKVATALSVLGFEMHEEPVSRIVRSDGKESTVFWFKSRNASGESAESVFHGMTKGGEMLAIKDPENVINYIRAALANRDELISLIRSTPRFVVVETNGKRIAIREGAGKEARAKFAGLL